MSACDDEPCHINQHERSARTASCFPKWTTLFRLNLWRLKYAIKPGLSQPECRHNICMGGLL